MIIRCKHLLPIALMGVTAVLAIGLAHADDLIIKIGHAGPVTGPSAHLGKDNENGARLAIEELNAKGTMIGGKKVKFVLIAEDDASDPKQAAAVAEKLVDAEVSGVIGHLNSSTSIAAAKIYSAAGIPQISPSTSSPLFTSMGFQTTFRAYANDHQLGGAMARYAVGVLKVKTVAIMDDRTAYGQGIADEFMQGVQHENSAVKFLPRQYTSDRATDFKAILTAIKSGKPDVVFFGGMDSVGGLMLRQMKALGVNATLLGGNGMCTGTIPGLAGDALGDDHVYCTETDASALTAEQKRALANFRVAYQKRFGEEYIMHAPVSYDAVMTMVDAMQQAKSADPAVYLPFLARIRHIGISGTIAFDEKGDLLDAPVTIFTFRGGQRVAVRPAHP